ncbi:MAG: DUF2513 domain-containing protein [Eubacteriaceae bacterium]
MQRDMELIRKILFAIEEKYVDTWLDSSEILIDSYDMKIIGYHCSLLYDAGLVVDYDGQYAEGELQYFCVGRLTWNGHELLDKIKSDTVWNKTKETITKKGIPFVLDAVKEIATAITTAMIQTAITNL